MEKSKIIIQDSNSHIASALRSLLSQIGYSVITIKNLKALHGLIKKFEPQLVIIECKADDKEARKILSEIKKDFGIKIIATCCNGKRTHLMENIGFDDCLVEPFDMEDVQQVITKQLVA